MRRVFAGLFALTLVFALTGCVKFKQLWTVNPDGSGKLTMTFAMSEQMLAMAGGQGEDPFAEFDPAEMIDEEENGWVAFTKPDVVSANGYKTMTLVGYFEDINKVKFAADDDGQMAASSFKMGDGKLTITNPIMGQIVAGMNEQAGQQDMSMMAPMLAGLEISEAYDLPGVPAAAPGYTIEGEIVTASINDQDVIKGNAAGPDAAEVVIEFNPGGWNGGEGAWKNELEAAKAEWKAIKASVGGGAEEAEDAEAPVMQKS